MGKHTEVIVIRWASHHILIRLTDWYYWKINFDIQIYLTPLQMVFFHTQCYDPLLWYWWIEKLSYNVDELPIKVKVEDISTKSQFITTKWLTFFLYSNYIRILMFISIRIKFIDDIIIMDCNGISTFSLKGLNYFTRR